MLSISRPNHCHSNRKWQNWLIYRISDTFLLKHKEHYQGVLYDLGCGEAPYREFFLQFAKEYVGVDWPESPHQTKETVLADLNDSLPIDSEVADTVVSISVLEHLHSPRKMVEEAFRILKPGGTFLLQVPWQ